MTTAEKTEKTLPRLKQRYREEIRDALRRIEKGTYGQCKNCDGPIPKARLNAAPWARHCIACQTEFEQNGGF